MFCPQWEASCTNVVGSTGEPYARCGDGYDGVGTFFLYFFTLSFLFYFHSMRTIPYLLHDFRLHPTLQLRSLSPFCSCRRHQSICTVFLSLSSFTLPSTLSCSPSYDTHISKLSTSTSTSSFFCYNLRSPSIALHTYAAPSIFSSPHSYLLLFPSLPLLPFHSL